MHIQKPSEEKINKIADEIYYLNAIEEPLSADVGIIYGKSKTYFYDVGRSQGARELIAKTKGPKVVIISHFHGDHMENLQYLLADPNLELYVGEHTYKYTRQGTVVKEPLIIEDGARLLLFPMPSCHAKGSLGLSVNGTYAFLGDALYSTMKGGNEVYNAQLLLEGIRCIEGLEAKYLLLSHKEPLLRTKKAVLRWLYHIYDKREKNNPYIRLC